MRYADLGDARIAYSVCGSGPPVVLLHGAFIDHRMWAPQVAFLRERYRVINLDLRGHGATGPTRAKPYSIPLFAADVEALLDHLGVERAIVCGLSMGGMVAQALAAARAERVPALVLAGTVWHSAPTRWNRLVRETALIHTAAKLCRGGEWRGRPERVREYSRDTLRAMPADEVAKVFEAFYRFEGVDWSRLTMPTLILYGERDSGGFRAQSLALRRRIPDAACEAIPAAGHTPTLENPRAFNAALGRFLARAG
jgi:pimeloyl-ACP methyl ester carboxylesterase